MATTYTQEYVQARDGNLYVGPSRVTVETIITNWQGLHQTPEQVHADFPSVPLAAIYGTIAYYLDHQNELDTFFREGEERFAARQAADEATHPEFYTERRRRFAKARKQSGLDDTSESPNA